MSQGRVSSSCGSQHVICRGRTGGAFSLPLIMTRLSGANFISLVFDLTYFSRKYRIYVR